MMRRFGGRCDGGVGGGAGGDADCVLVAGRRQLQLGCRRLGVAAEAVRFGHSRSQAVAAVVAQQVAAIERLNLRNAVSSNRGRILGPLWSQVVTTAVEFRRLR